MHKKQQSDTYSRRFGFPKDCCEKTHLEFKEIHTKDETMKHTVKELTKRNDTQ